MLGKLPLVGEPALRVTDALAGVEFNGAKARLGGVGVELLLRETERVLSVGLVQCIAEDGERRSLIRPVAKPEVRGIA